jgi:hypothetical protein
MAGPSLSFKSGEAEIAEWGKGRAADTGITVFKREGQGRKGNMAAGSLSLRGAGDKAGQRASHALS